MQQPPSKVNKNRIHTREKEYHKLKRRIKEELNEANIQSLDCSEAMSNLMEEEPITLWGIFQCSTVEESNPQTREMDYISPIIIFVCINAEENP